MQSSSTELEERETEIVFTITLKRNRYEITEGQHDEGMSNKGGLFIKEDSMFLKMRDMGL